MPNRDLSPIAAELRKLSKVNTGLEVVTALPHTPELTKLAEGRAPTSGADASVNIPQALAAEVRDGLRRVAQTPDDESPAQRAVRARRVEILTALLRLTPTWYRKTLTRCREELTGVRAGGDTKRFRENEEADALEALATSILAGSTYRRSTGPREWLVALSDVLTFLENLTREHRRLHGPSASLRSLSESDEKQYENDDLAYALYQFLTKPLAITRLEANHAVHEMTCELFEIERFDPGVPTQERTQAENEFLRRGERQDHSWPHFTIREHDLLISAAYESPTHFHVFMDRLEQSATGIAALKRWIAVLRKCECEASADPACSLHQQLDAYEAAAEWFESLHSDEELEGLAGYTPVAKHRIDRQRTRQLFDWSQLDEADST